MKFTLKIPEETKQLWRSLWHNRWLRYSAYALGITIPLTVYAALISIPHTFVGGQLVRAGEVNTNFKTLYDTLGITEAKGLTVGANIEAQGFTLNGVPVGSSSDSFWSTAGGSNITYSNGMVGVGITPTVPLHVSGDITATGTVTAANFTGTVTGNISGNAATVSTVAPTASGYIPKWNGTALVDSNVFQNGSGNVGIGTTSISAKLHINGGSLRAVVENNWNVLSAYVYSNNAGHSGGAAGYRARGTEASSQYVQTGDTMASFTGRDAKNQSWGGMAIKATETHTLLTAGGNKIEFSTVPNTNTLVPSVRMVILETGDVGIGTGTPAEKLQVNGNLRIVAAATCIIGPTTTCTSDRRLKSNIIPLSSSLDKIMNLQGVSFTINKDKEHKKHIGFIAQNVRKSFPEVVSTDKPTGMLMVAYSDLIAPLVEATKEQQTQIEKLKTENKLVKAKNAQLEARLDRIERMMARAN